MNKDSISMAQLHVSSSCSETREKETKKQMESKLREMVVEGQGWVEDV